MSTAHVVILSFVVFIDSITNIQSRSPRDHCHARQLSLASTTVMGEVEHAFYRCPGYGRAISDDRGGTSCPRAHATREPPPRQVRRSALLLRQASGDADSIDAQGTQPGTGHLARAASHLAAGHDLLLERRDPGPPGPR